MRTDEKKERRLVVGIPNFNLPKAAFHSEKNIASAFIN
jgi:hypothetical protein